MSFLIIAAQMLSLFLIMAVGYVAYKVHMLDEQASVYLTKVVLNISIPAQILSSFLENRGQVPTGTVLEVFGLSILSFAVYFGIGIVFLLLARVPREQRGVYMFMTVFGNVGFMGYPVITAVFGQEALIYAVIFNVMFNMAVYSFGIMLIGGNQAGGFNPKLLLNVPMVVAVLAIVLFFTTIQLPSFLMSSLDYMANLTTPLAMLILGATIARIPLRELFDDGRVFVFTAVRLIGVPIVIMGVMHLLGIRQPLVAGTMVILAGTPVATNTTMLAIEYGGDIHLASKGIFFSTILSVLTIPVIAMFL